MVVSTGSTTRGDNIACLLLHLLCQSGRINIFAVPRILEFSSSLLVHALPTMGSMNSAHSEEE